VYLNLTLRHWLWQLVATAILAASGATAVAQIADAPLLRIDTGAHSAPLRAMDVDSQGRFAVTASEDKTARIWDLSNGQLLQTLRPPIGAGNDGRLFAAAITPDGETVAVGGWSPDNDVYLFDRASGTMVQRITGLPNTITHLSFSPNGQMLAIGLWGKNGLRMFGSTSRWRASQELAGDANYDGEIYGTQFSPDGTRLASASVDGSVRLYDVSEKRLKLIHSERPGSNVGGANQPFSVSFSPDGHWLAAGFADKAAVAVVQADNLKFAFAPAVDAKTDGSLSALAWSVDGRELMAAGTWTRADGTHGLKRWANGGRGAATDVSLSRNSVVALRTLAGGRVAFAATDPAWGVLPLATGASSATQSSSSGLMEFRGGRDTFRLAPDASAVAFGAGNAGSPTLGFDLRGAAWITPAPAWQAAKSNGTGVQISDWADSLSPKLNGRPLALTDGEMSTSVAVASTGGGFALGTSFYLRFYKADGSLTWRVAAPASTWQVSVSNDSKWVVAAFGDGSIRWFRMRDGVEIVALLPHADQKRWVAWTPQGYYMASPGGEDLFGWHVNRGASTRADFFPGSRFRASFYRPDVIAALLDTADIEAALRITRPAVAAGLTTTASIDLKTPPVVTVLSPQDGSSFSSREVTLSVSVQAPAGAPPVSLRARMNGNNFELPLAQASQWTGARNLVVDAVELLAPPGTRQVRYEQRITLPAQDVELMLFSDNRNGYSTPAVVRLKWAGGTAAAGGSAPIASPRPTVSAADAVEAALRPALYVLAVGISKYQNANIQLAFASKDASDFANVFKLQEKQLYRKVEVKLLTDANAKRDDILDGLEWIRREMTSRDVGVVFMAGHGVNDSDGVYYYLPQDTDTDKLKRTGVIFTEIRNTLAALPGKALFFVDTCHSGNVLGTGRRSVTNDLTAVVNELSSAENGVIVFAASTGRQFAQESPEWGNGAFTKAVIEGMSGKADVGRTGRVTHKMLDLYVSERVKALTRGTQSPVTIVPQGISDFPVAISR
jgi:WD40 repeat protein